MTITLHDDVLSLLKQEATELNVTIEEAANFLIRFGMADRPLRCEREMLILNSHGTRIYEYSTGYRQQGS